MKHADHSPAQQLQLLTGEAVELDGGVEGAELLLQRAHRLHQPPQLGLGLGPVLKMKTRVRSAMFSQSQRLYYLLGHVMSI